MRPDHIERLAYGGVGLDIWLLLQRYLQFIQIARRIQSVLGRFIPIFPRCQGLFVASRAILCLTFLAKRVAFDRTRTHLWNLKYHWTIKYFNLTTAIASSMSEAS